MFHGQPRSRPRSQEALATRFKVGFQQYRALNGASSSIHQGVHLGLSQGHLPDSNSKYEGHQPASLAQTSSRTSGGWPPPARPLLSSSSRVLSALVRKSERHVEPRATSREAVANVAVPWASQVRGTYLHSAPHDAPKPQHLALRSRMAGDFGSGGAADSTFLAEVTGRDATPPCLQQRMLVPSTPGRGRSRAAPPFQLSADVRRWKEGLRAQAAQSPSPEPMRRPQQQEEFYEPQHHTFPQYGGLNTPHAQQYSMLAEPQCQRGRRPSMIEDPRHQLANPRQKRLPQQEELYEPSRRTMAQYGGHGGLHTPHMSQPQQEELYEPQRHNAHYGGLHTPHVNQPSMFADPQWQRDRPPPKRQWIDDAGHLPESPQRKRLRCREELPQPLQFAFASHGGVRTPLLNPSSMLADAPWQRGAGVTRQAAAVRDEQDDVGSVFASPKRRREAASAFDGQRSGLHGLHSLPLRRLQLDTPPRPERNQGSQRRRLSSDPLMGQAVSPAVLGSGAYARKDACEELGELGPGFFLGSKR